MANVSESERLFSAAKLGLLNDLRRALEDPKTHVALRGTDGRTALHFAAGYGNEEVCEELLNRDAPPAAVDDHGDAPLHLCAAHGHPMAAFALAKAAPAAVMLRNSLGQTPVECAAACGNNEVLNAVLLGCAGLGSVVAVAALQTALECGAVPDTWAPNGSSALMLAAAADSGTACHALLEGQATLELADALGRTALMFAAGNNACNALQTLLTAGASVAVRDRRGRCVSEYAQPSSDAAAALAAHLATLEQASEAMQRELLASLEPGAAPEVTPQAAAKAAKKAAKKAKRRAALTAAQSQSITQASVASEPATLWTCQKSSRQPGGNMAAATAPSMCDDTVKVEDHASSEPIFPLAVTPDSSPLQSIDAGIVHGTSRSSSPGDRAMSVSSPCTVPSALRSKFQSSCRQPQQPANAEPDAQGNSEGEGWHTISAGHRTRMRRHTAQIQLGAHPNDSQERRHFTHSVQPTPAVHRDGGSNSGRSLLSHSSSPCMSLVSSCSTIHVAPPNYNSQKAAVPPPSYLRAATGGSDRINDRVNEAPTRPQLHRSICDCSDDGSSAPSSIRRSSALLVAPPPPAAAAGPTPPGRNSDPHMRQQQQQPRKGQFRSSAGASSDDVGQLTPAYPSAPDATTNNACSQMGTLTWAARLKRTTCDSEHTQPTAHAAHLSVSPPQQTMLLSPRTQSLPNSEICAETESNFCNKNAGIKSGIVTPAQGVRERLPFARVVSPRSPPSPQTSAESDSLAQLQATGSVTVAAPVLLQGSTNSNHCTSCHTLRATAAASIVSAAAEHQRSAVLQVQVADCHRQMAALERSHTVQLAAVLRDAAAHEGAAVEAAIAATLAAVRPPKAESHAMPAEELDWSEFAAPIRSSAISSAMRKEAATITLQRSGMGFAILQDRTPKQANFADDKHRIVQQNSASACSSFSLFGSTAHSTAAASLKTGDNSMPRQLATDNQTFCPSSFPVGTRRSDKAPDIDIGGGCAISRATLASSLGTAICTAAPSHTTGNSFSLPHGGIATSLRVPSPKHRQEASCAWGDIGSVLSGVADDFGFVTNDFLTLPLNCDKPADHPGILQSFDANDFEHLATPLLVPSTRSWDSARVSSALKTTSKGASPRFDSTGSCFQTGFISTSSQIGLFNPLGHAGCVDWSVHSTAVL